MFQTTFLGHQGWMFSSKRATILVDPLLVEEFGHAGVVGQVYPPRQFSWGRFPKIDAVFYTHEHEDHFNIPSLHRLDRRIPIFIPARSSVAAREILAEMGFKVTTTQPGGRYRFKDLEYLAFSPNHVTYENLDEYDVLPFLVRHLGGDGSFFSSVDVAFDPGISEDLRRVLDRPGLWSFANNTCDLAFMTLNGKSPRGTELLEVSKIFLEAMLDMERGWRAPEAYLVCGGGYSLRRDLARLNREVFCSDSNRICDALAKLRPEGTFAAAFPGQTVVMEKNRITAMKSSTGFLKTPARSRWPNRAYRPSAGKHLDEFPPACGKTRFDPDDIREIKAGLSRFASHLNRGPLFSALYSLRKAADGRKPTFAWVVRTGKGQPPRVLEYDPSACTFLERPAAGVERRYLSVAEVWATDLAALFRGEFGPSGIVFGRMRLRDFAPETLQLASVLREELCRFHHPLRLPDVYLKMYRALSAQEQAQKSRPLVFGKRS